MQEIILDASFLRDNQSSFDGNELVLESYDAEENFSPLFNKIRSAIKNRGLLGGLGQVTGLSTEKGAERRAANRTARQDRKNLKSDSKAAERFANAESTKGQGSLLSSLAAPSDSSASASPAPLAAGAPLLPDPKKDSKLPLYLGIGGGVLVVVILIVVVLIKSKSK